MDRSGYNEDDAVAAAFERATKRAFDLFSQTDQYKNFMEKKRREDEKDKRQILE